MTSMTINPQALIATLSKLPADVREQLRMGLSAPTAVPAPVDFAEFVPTPLAAPKGVDDVAAELAAAKAENERLKAAVAKKAAKVAKATEEKGVLNHVGLTESGKIEFGVSGSTWKHQLPVSLLVQILERHTEIAGFCAKNMRTAKVYGDTDAQVAAARTDLFNRAVKLARK